jgi:hypothetical protein
MGLDWDPSTYTSHIAGMKEHSTVFCFLFSGSLAILFLPRLVIFCSFPLLICLYFLSSCSYRYEPLNSASLFFFFLMIVIPTGEQWDLNVVLICISFIAKDFELSFVYSLVIFTNFENFPFIDWIFLMFIFWCPYILWLLILCLLNSW